MQSSLYAVKCSVLTGTSESLEKSSPLFTDLSIPWADVFS